MKRLTSYLGTLLAALSIATSSFAYDLDLNQGAMTIGGQVNANYNISNLGSGAGVLAVGGKFSMSFFAVDYLSAGFNLIGTGVFNYTGSPTTSWGDAGGGFNLNGYFWTGTDVYPYLGINGNVMWSQSSPKGNKNTVRIDIVPEVGFLVALNDYVALNFGVDATFLFPLTNTAATAGVKNPETIGVNLGGGYIGVKGFF